MKNNKDLFKKQIEKAKEFLSKKGIELKLETNSTIGHVDISRINILEIK